MKGRLSRILVALVVALALFGHLMIYSASSYVAGLRGDEWHYVKKQAIGLLLGIGLMIGGSIINLKKLRSASVILLIVSYVALGLVFVPGLGVESYGARRWLDLKFITFQPSELMKFSLVIYLADYGAKKKVDGIKRLIPPLLAGGIGCVLIMAEPNMSVTICIGAVLVIMLILSGLKTSHLACLAVPAIAACVVLIIAEPYRYDRLLAFIDPWANPKGEGYQLIQSYYAIGSGGLFGVGLFNSRQKFLFLPFAESDFIFSVIAEETGYLGCLLLIAVYLVIVFIGFYAAVTASDRFSTLLAAGTACVIGVQTLLNVAVVSGSIPPTGIPLPFISAGGTSLAVFMGAAGLMLNVLLGKSHETPPLRHKMK